MRGFIIVAVAACLGGTAASQETPTATALRAGLAGQWSGALGYRDYQSNELFEIPVTTRIEAIEDGATLVRRSLFNDGPGNPVWITTVSLHDPVTNRVTSGSYRKGRAVELSVETVAVTRYADPTHWVIVYSQTGRDDDAPADIRMTETRDGDSLLEIKEVRPVGAGDDAWAYRNQTRLSRAGN